MTNLDNDLSELRRRLHRAAARDLRRGRRRRRVAQLALVPVVLLTGTAGAFAVAPMLGEPAPTTVQQEFHDDRSRVPAPKSGLPGPDTPLYAVARAGGSTLYAGTDASGWCLTVGRENVSGRATDGYSCQPNDIPKPGKVAVVHAGGASDRAHNVATGYVREAARTLTIELSTGETVDGEIGRDGFFIVQLPDSVLSGATTPTAGPPVVGALARDADGEIVARWETPGPIG